VGSSLFFGFGCLSSMGSLQSNSESAGLLFQLFVWGSHRWVTNCSNDIEQLTNHMLSFFLKSDRTKSRSIASCGLLTMVDRREQFYSFILMLAEL
jgi:hypothetical protein